MCSDQCKVWRMIAMNIKTQDQSKTDFNVAYTNFIDIIATSNQVGYKNVQFTVYNDVVGVIKNLLFTALPEKEIVSVLTTIVS